MICSNCHKEVTDFSAITCPECGKQLIMEPSHAEAAINGTLEGAASFTEEAAADFAQKMNEAGQELRECFSLKKQLSNLAAIQTAPLQATMAKIKDMPSDAKKPGEKLLYKDAALYGANSGYMQNANIELTPERIIFYEHVFTGSGILNVMTSVIAPRYSFSLQLTDIAKIQVKEFNYRKGHLLTLRNEEQMILQCSNHSKFDAALRIALDNACVQK